MIYDYKKVALSITDGATIKDLLLCKVKKIIGNYRYATLSG